MSGTIQESYSPVIVPGTGTFRTAGLTKVGGFLCTVSGTISILDTKSVVIIPPIAVVAGAYLPFPFAIGYNFQIVSAGGAAGVMACG